MNEALPTEVYRRRVPRRKRRFRFQVLRGEEGPSPLFRAAEAPLFFFLCLSECFRLPSPFAACAFSAWLLCKRRILFPALGILLSLGLRAFWQSELDLWQYAGLALLALLRLRPPRSLSAASACTACALSLRLFGQILFPTTQENMILCTLSLLTGALCTPAVCHVLRMTEGVRSRLSVDDLLCAAVLCAVMLAGAGRVALGPLNLGFVLAGLAVLLAAGTGGCMASVCAGLLAGVSLALCGHPAGYAVCFAFSGILCGLIYGRRRIILCLIYLLCSLFCSYAVRFQPDLPFLTAAGTACGLFLLLPRRAVAAAFTAVRALSPDGADNAAAYAAYMRTQTMGSIARLARQLPEIRLPHPDAEEQLEDVAARLCADCERQIACWQESAEETRAVLSRYFIAGEKSVQIDRCPRREDWPALAAERERQARQLSLRTAYAQREREATRTHLYAIAQAMNRIAREGGVCDRDDDTLRGEAEYALRRMRISGRILFALRVAGHVRVALRYEPQLTRQAQLDRYCTALTQALGIPLHAAQRSKDVIMYEETPPLTAESCHLSASAGSGDGANGDNVLLRSGAGGIELTMLSDGMGHGDEAHIESKQTLELLSLCLDAGYTVPAALQAINCIMLSSTDGEQYATVDLCAADLWQGTLRLHKLGACPSLLISGASLQVLESSALPLGILPEIEESAHSAAIGDGDMLIQFTDGLSDACGGMQAMTRQTELLMRDRLHRSPEAVCTALMSAAMRRCGGSPPDDMTVLCTLFRKRQTKKRRQTLREENEEAI